VNCRDAERLLDTFFDGELEGRLMREAALHVTRCKRCEAEIVDRERIHDLLGAAIDEDLAAVDVGRIWSGVEAAIAEAEPLSRERRTGAMRPAQWFRLAAASTRANGVIVGRGRRIATLGADAAHGADDELDPSGHWLRPEATVARRGTWSVAAITAIAASLVAAVLLGRDGAPTKPALVASAPEATPEIGAVAMVNPAVSQMKVESVDYSGRSLAMWTEPETDTTVIWVDDEETGAAK
jgi:hypothetical protein